MKIHQIFSLLFLFTVCFSSLLVAQGPPINTDTPILLGLEGRAVMFRAVVVSKSRLYEDGHRISDSLDRKISAITFPLAIPFNVTSDLLVGAMIPFISVNSTSIIEDRSSFGLGDMSLFAKYLVVQIDGLQETFRVIGKGSIKLPTGNKDRTPTLGSGTVDYSIGTAAAWIGKRFGLYGDVSYAFNGTSANLSHGNVLHYNAALGFRAIPAVYEQYPTEQLNFYLEFNGDYAMKDRLNGNDLRDTGGNLVFLSPGIQYVPSRIFLVEASLQFPVIQSPNGIQLGFNVIAIAGIRILLY